MSYIRLLKQGENYLHFIAYNSFCEITFGEPVVTDRLCSQILNELSVIRKMLDVYDERSELSAVRNLPPMAELKLSDELFALLEKLIEAGKFSGGCFDCTVGELSRLWNFNADAPCTPDEASIQRALSRTGSGLLHLNSERKTIMLQKEGVFPDAGAAGKGYAVGKIVELLRNNGIRQASVDLGGNLYLLGDGPVTGKWRVGIQQPWGLRRKTVGYLMLPGNISVSTSGGYERFFMKDGLVYHHLLDPATGYPIVNDVLSSTVVCTDACMGDILSTVLFTGGADAMQRTAQGLCPLSFCGYVVIRSDGTVEVSDELEQAFCI